MEIHSNCYISNEDVEGAVRKAILEHFIRGCVLVQPLIILLTWTQEMRALLQQLEPIFIFSELSILKPIASKHVDNFPPHPSCVVTLPKNTLAIKEARCFPLRGWPRIDDAFN